MSDFYANLGASAIGYGERPGVVVIDFQIGLIDEAFPLGGGALIERAVENTAKLLPAARAAKAPVVACNLAYSGLREMPPWKIPEHLKGEFLRDHPGTVLDTRIYDPGYDTFITKTSPSIFFNSAVAQFFVKEGVDTIIVTGCNTSGCVRASVVDAFSLGFRVIVPEPCVGDPDERPHQDNLRDMQRRYADVVSLEDALAYLAEREQHNLKGA